MKEGDKLIRRLKINPILLLVLGFFLSAAWAILGFKMVEDRTSPELVASAPPTIAPAPETISPNAASPIPRLVFPISPAEESEVISSYRYLAGWAGTGNKTTDNFEITEAPWIIVWSFEAGKITGPHASVLQIYVRQPENSCNTLAVHVGGAQDTQQGSLYIHDLVGKSYLQVCSQSGSWNIKVLVKE